MSCKSLTSLKFLSHIIIALFSLLNLLSHRLLLSFIFFNKIACLLNLSIDQAEPITESSPCFFFGLIYENTSDLFVNFSI